MNHYREPDCTCCNSARQVMAASGELRPCSRCRHREFKAWFDARRPQAPAAPLFDFATPQKGDTP